MKKILTKKLALAAIVMAMAPVMLMALPAFAQQPDLGINYVAPLNLANADPREAAVSLIKLLMTFLGIIAVVIILYGGFVWLTAAGNEDKVATAKKVIAAGIIGLIIILAAFLIVNFVITNVSTSLGA
ncbi:MAG: hypothetical protein MUC28_03415 [Planctomycetes bacterium]|jgi:hypothetical protein|nr:hypothetical protein [Planctomycetota bacterium]